MLECGSTRRALRFSCFAADRLRCPPISSTVAVVAVFVVVMVVAVAAMVVVVAAAIAVVVAVAGAFLMRNGEKDIAARSPFLQVSADSGSWCGNFCLGSMSCHVMSPQASHLSRFIFDMTPPKIEPFIEKIVATNGPRAKQLIPCQVLWVHSSHM